MLDLTTTEFSVLNGHNGFSEGTPSMNAGWANLLITIEHGRLPRRRLVRNPTSKSYIIAVVVLLIAIGLLWA